MCFFSRFLLYLGRTEKTILPKMSENTFSILYGSQTGQAKAIAEEIFEQADGFDLKAKLLCLSTTDKKVITRNYYHRSVKERLTMINYFPGSVMAPMNREKMDEHLMVNDVIFL